MSGWIEIVCGGMFSGKTEELIRRVRRAQYAHQKVQVFKAAADKRYAKENVASHNNVQIEAKPVQSAREILRLLESDTEVVAIDEAQFFGHDIVSVCEELASFYKLRVIIAGLNLDALGRPFGSMPGLLARADHITTLNAICVKCGGLASRTQLLINDQPVQWQEGPLILVGGESEGYEARCRSCHEVPDKPERK